MTKECYDRYAYSLYRRAFEELRDTRLARELVFQLFGEADRLGIGERELEAYLSRNAERGIQELKKTQNELEDIWDRLSMQKKEEQPEEQILEATPVEDVRIRELENELNERYYRHYEEEWEEARSEAGWPETVPAETLSPSPQKSVSEAVPEAEELPSSRAGQKPEERLVESPQRGTEEAEPEERPRRGAEEAKPEERLQRKAEEETLETETEPAQMSHTLEQLSKAFSREERELDEFVRSFDFLNEVEEETGESIDPLLQRGAVSETGEEPDMARAFEEESPDMKSASEEEPQSVAAALEEERESPGERQESEPGQLTPDQGETREAEESFETYAEYMARVDRLFREPGGAVREEEVQEEPEKEEETNAGALTGSEVESAQREEETPEPKEEEALETEQRERTEADSLWEGPMGGSRLDISLLGGSLRSDEERAEKNRSLRENGSQREEAEAEKEEEDGEKGSSIVQLFLTLCLFVVIAALVWMIVNVLMYVGVLPKLDFGYRWFNETVYPLFWV